MKKLFKRIVAYLIDMLVVLLITQCLSGIPQINRQLDDYNEYYNDYIELYQNYASFKVELSKFWEDEKLVEDEYNTLINEHESYIDILNNYYIDNELTTENYDKLNKEIDKEYYASYSKIYYKIEQNSIAYLVIYLVVVFAYFVGFNIITKGQTLGKKLMKLKIVNSKDSDKGVFVWSYIVRVLILYQPIYYLVRLIGINFMSANMYYEVTNIIYSIQGYLEMLIIVMMMIRLDGRGPQDFLACTRVALYDRNGKEIKDRLNIMVSEKMEEVKNVNGSNKKVTSKGKHNKKVIDEESTK